MRLRTVNYVLEIHKLDHPYSNQEDVRDSKSLRVHHTSTPFGVLFRVGDTVTDGPPLAKLGTIEHIHHEIADVGENPILHTTKIYLR